jgi:hypothetical protein
MTQPDSGSGTPSGDSGPAGPGALSAAASALGQEDPGLVARAADECEARARRDHLGGMARGKATVLALRDLTVERPALGIAVARTLGLEHIVDDLLAGRSVDGVTGIGPGGEVLPPSRSDRRRRRGAVLLVLGGGVLLTGATVADSLSLVLVIAWTACSFALIFGGLRDVLHSG